MLWPPAAISANLCSQGSRSENSGSARPVASGWFECSFDSSGVLNFSNDECQLMTSRRKSSSSRPKRQQPDFDALLHKRQRFTMTENGNISSHPTSDLSDSELETARLGKRRWVDRTEYLRLLMQSLYDLGYGRVAAQLEAETQLKHESPTVVDLRGAVMDGDWDKALELLRSVPVETDVGRRRAEFLLIEEKFLEVRDWKPEGSRVRNVWLGGREEGMEDGTQSPENGIGAIECQCGAIARPGLVPSVSQCRRSEVCGSVGGAV